MGHPRRIRADVAAACSSMWKAWRQSCKVMTWTPDGAILSSQRAAPAPAWSIRRLEVVKERRRARAQSGRPALGRRRKVLRREERLAAAGGLARPAGGGRHRRAVVMPDVEVEAGRALEQRPPLHRRARLVVAVVKVSASRFFDGADAWSAQDEQQRHLLVLRHPQPARYNPSPGARRSFGQVSTCVFMEQPSRSATSRR